MKDFEFSADLPAINNHIVYQIFKQMDNSSLMQATNVNAKWYNHFFQSFTQTFEDLLSQTRNVVDNKANTLKKIAELPAVYADKYYSYEEINNKINQLANYLQSLSLPSETAVGLFLYQSLDYIISVLAIMKSGLTFIPLSADPELPVNRLLDYLNGCDAKLVITHSHLQTRAFLHAAEMQKIKKIYLDQSPNIFSTLVLDSPDVAILPSQLAYILNTSGSTGKPKKVLIKHRGLNYCMLAHHDVLQITHQDRIAAFADTSFDAHIIEIMMALGKGACLYVVPFETRINLNKLSHFYSSHNITVAIFTPSMLRQLNPEHFPHLRVLISTGEKIDKETIKKWCYQGRPRNQPRLFVNGYGPSEVTIATTLGICTPDQEIDIGRAIPGLEVLILSKNRMIQKRLNTLLKEK